MALSKAESKKFFPKLVRLNDAVGQNKLDIIKLVAKHAFGIGQEDLDKADLPLTSIYTLLEEKHGTSAINILIMILEGVQPSLVDSLKEHEEKEIVGVGVDDLRMMDFILTVSCILCCLGEKKYLSLKELARRTFLSHYDPSNITSRTHLLQLLLEGNSFTPDSFHNLFAWLEVVGCSLYHEKLREYCKRHQLVVPEWESLVQTLKDECPKPCESDVESHSYPVAAPIRSDGGQSGSQSLSVKSAAPFTTSGGGRFDYAPSPTASYQHSPHHEVESGPTAMVAAINGAPKTNAVLVHGHQEKASGDGKETNCQFPMESELSDGETNNESGNNTELHLPESESSPEGCEEGKLHMDSRSPSRIPDDDPVNNAVTNPDSPSRTDSPTISPMEVHKEKKPVAKMKDWVCQHKSPVCVVSSLVFLLVVIAVSTGVSTYFLIGSNPDNKTVLLAENATVNIGCYDFLHIGHFTISADAKTSFTFFAVPQPKLLATKTTFPVMRNKRAGTNYILSLNYYHSFPLYAAGSGTLSYYVNFTNFDCNKSDISSYFYFYLFNSPQLYNEALKNLGPASGFIDSFSFCPNSTNKDFNYTFTLPSRGFHYVAAYMPSHLNIEYKISAEVPTYDVTYLEGLGIQSCRLDGSSCLLDVGHHPVHVHANNVCLLASSSSDLRGDIINGTLSPHRYIFNASSVSTVFVGSGLCVTIFITAVCFYIFLKIRASRQSNYQRVPVLSEEQV